VPLSLPATYAGVMKRILVPLDRSSESEAALREAFDLFPEAKIHAFHVVQVTEFPQDPNKSAYELAVEKGREILTRADEIAGKHNRKIETATKRTISITSLWGVRVGREQSGYCLGASPSPLHAGHHVPS